MRLTKNSIEKISPKSEVCQFQDQLVSELWLAVYPSGEKVWHLHLHIQGKEKNVSIGPYPKFDLHSARKTACEQLEKRSDDAGSDILLCDNWRRLDDQKRVQLSKVIRDRKKVKFRPNLFFQDRKKMEKKVADLRLKERERSKLYRQKQEELEIDEAWKTYQQTKNPATLSGLLRSENVINNPLPPAMAQEIANFLDQVTPQSQDSDNVADDRVFMTYWRHTELKNGVEPLLMDLDAVSECVTFMEAIGRPLPHENIELRLKLGYAAWRENNNERLEKTAKVLLEMTDKLAEGEDQGDEDQRDEVAQ